MGGVGACSGPLNSEKPTSSTSLEALLSESSLFEELPLECLDEEVFYSLGRCMVGKQ